VANQTVGNVLSKLVGVKRTGNQWMARCPAHEDDHASLSVAEGEDGKVLLRCHACCGTEAIVSALGLTLSDLFPNERRPTYASNTILATYDYHDASGRLKYQTVRFPPQNGHKVFRQRRPDGAGGWIWKTQGLRKVPYRLPQLKGQAFVLICEGEKDCDALWNVGLPATTNVGGAGNWGESETKALVKAGAQRVVILPDHDAAGYSHAEKVATSCRQAGLAVSIIHLPGVPEKGGDVSDFLASGRTRADLDALIQSAPYVVPSSALPVALPSPAAAIDPTSDPSRYHLTDLGAAEAFRDRYGDTLRFDWSRQQWYLWNGTIWRPDSDAQADRLAHDHVRCWQREAADLPAGHPRRADLMVFTLRLERRGGIEAFFTMARKLIPIATDGHEWDANPWLLGCQNGVIDLRTGAHRAGVPADKITHQAGVAYVPDASAPRWHQFLDEIFDEDEALIHYMHQALGYSLTGDMREQCFFLGCGPGSNGKSVLFDTMEHVWGTYACRSNMRTFVAAQHSDDRFSLAELESRRLILASETKSGTKMNEHILKNITGGESQQAERKYGHPFTFRPTCKIWLGVNHEPKVTDDSFGFWRRVRLIPFLRTFIGSSDDPTLRATLQDEAEGILAWCVQGCLAWQQSGRLTIPPSVMAATDVYEHEQDPLADFLAQMTHTEDPNAEVSLAILYQNYKTWADALKLSSFEVLSSKAVSARLKKRFAMREVHGYKRVRGLTLLSETKDLLD